jgi:CHAT domain-containing protein
MPFLLQKTVLRYEYSARLALQPHLQRSHLDFFAGYAPAYEGEVPMPARGENTSCGNAESTRFAPLLNNQSEVSQIAGLVGGRAFLGAEASEQVFQQHLHEPRVIHLAMHGFLNDCDPLYSGLAFSPQAAGRQGEENDGILHAYEIYNLKMNAELAVLSACNTGRGQLAKGEGVISLARAFKYAGCPNVLMSLWQADDQATSQIMQYFYQNLKRGMSKDVAIRQAKLDYLGAANRDHPFFWGAFVLIGDGEPVRQPALWHWYGLALLLLAGMGLWIWRAKRKG